jgi:hypothetical protein
LLSPVSLDLILILKGTNRDSYESGELLSLVDSTSLGISLYEEYKNNCLNSKHWQKKDALCGHSGFLKRQPGVY